MVHTMNFTPPKAGLLGAKRLALARRTAGSLRFWWLGWLQRLLDTQLQPAFTFVGSNRPYVNSH
jgi:hypothetical protein